MSAIFKNPATEAKIQLFFLFVPKDPFGELFSKIIFKSFSEFLFSKIYESSKSAKTYLICKISIGLSVHFHNGIFFGIQFVKIAEEIRKIMQHIPFQKLRFMDYRSRQLFNPAEKLFSCNIERNALTMCSLCF